MESAIPEHLKCPRTRTRRIEDDYAPPYPGFTARARQEVKQVVMGYFGVQSSGKDMQGKACAALLKIARTFKAADGPEHHDLAHYVDEAGYDNMIAIAYWTSPESFAKWRAGPDVDEWWSSADRLTDGIGYFREIVSPRVEGYETLFSAPDQLEGIGVAMGGRSKEDVQEHGYWGSMRDRFPLSQTDPMKPSGELKAESPSLGKRVIAALAGTPSLGKRVKVKGHENVALIRSGQDWTETTGKERDLYLKDMEPVFRTGMDFLRDQGKKIGCYTNRYMQHLDASGKPIEKSFGLSYWHSLADMERWAEAHPTHVDIFGTFMRIVQELNFQLQLRLYHEVSVLKPEEQEYEYINCHPKTGLMNGLAH